MPRYWTGSGIGGLLSAQDERAAGRRHRPAQVHGDLGVLHLTAATGGVIVGVDSLRRLRAVVVRGAPELPDVLDDHRHPVRVALAQVTTRRVVGALASQLDDAARYVSAALALLAEAVLLELEHRRESEGVVGAGDADVLRPDPGLTEDDVLGVITGHPRDGAVGPVEVGARLRHAPGHPHDVD